MTPLRFISESLAEGWLARATEGPRQTLWHLRQRRIRKTSKSLSRQLFGAVFGRRLPKTRGVLKVHGIGQEVIIHRDAFGIPYIEAPDEAHAWFGQGFCEGQDRAFQIEFLLRAVRGTLSEVIGPRGLPADRLARRLGFVESSKIQYGNIADDVRDDLDAFVRGINAGIRVGASRRAHEFTLIRSKPSLFRATDAIGIVKLLSFAMGSNWDSELARFKILSEDGPEALKALSPVYPEQLGVSAKYGVAAGATADRLAEDLTGFRHTVGLGSASNNWVVSGKRSASGRPIMANDPHFPSALPCYWYLSQTRTPQRTVTGASFVGSPGFGFGYNDHSAWGATAGHIDNADLALEEIGPDGKSVRRGDKFVACEVRREEIRVRGHKPVVEEVLVTPDGPIVSPAFEDNDEAAFSIRATWLNTGAARGLIHLHRCKTFADLEDCFEAWPALSLNMVFANVDDEIGWKLVGEAPRRKKGWGIIPAVASDPSVGWNEDSVPASDMPKALNPSCGFIATANNQPLPDGEGPFLGQDWFDGYRQARISELLAQRDDWTVDDFRKMQLDTLSIPWREIAPIVTKVNATSPQIDLALTLLSNWDGRIAADSPAATLFEVFLGHMIERVARAKAPKSAEWAIGKGFIELAPHSSMAFRRVGHLVTLLRSQPDNWFDTDWNTEISKALESAVTFLRKRYGKRPDKWAWGRVRPLELIHPVGETAPLNRVFNLGPFVHNGDTNTISSGPVPPHEPTSNPMGVANLRTVVEVGNWENNYWALAGGQSGNPLSPHYDDMMALWLKGEGVTIPWSKEGVKKAKRTTLRLKPLYASNIPD